MRILSLLLKCVSDVKSVSYDSDGFLSLPRLISFVLFICVLISWIASQFFSLPFDNFESLCGILVGALGAYGWKKHEESKGGKPRDE